MLPKALQYYIISRIDCLIGGRGWGSRRYIRDVVEIRFRLIRNICVTTTLSGNELTLNENQKKLETTWSKERWMSKFDGMIAETQDSACGLTFLYL